MPKEDKVKAACRHLVANGATDTWKESRLDHAGLPNAFQVHANVISGGVPDGDEGFMQLKRIGVKTIISVDGARPDVETAKKFGLRYVHLPHGYDGISSSHARTLAKAISILPGPIYIHCHHGKHRSPAAAMVACVGAGLAQPQQGIAFLKAAGTSPKYVSLYAAVNDSRPFEQAELINLDAFFPEIAEVPPLAKVMVDIEKTFDKLILANRSKWNASALDPDIDPSHDALMLREHFAETLRTFRGSDKPKEFRRILQDSHEAASKTEALLNQRPLSAETLSELSSQISTIKADCRRCHAKHRDRSAN